MNISLVALMAFRVEKTKVLWIYVALLTTLNSYGIFHNILN